MKKLQDTGKVKKWHHLFHEKKNSVYLFCTKSTVCILYLICICTQPVLMEKNYEYKNLH